MAPRLHGLLLKLISTHAAFSFAVRFNRLSLCTFSPPHAATLSSHFRCGSLDFSADIAISYMVRMSRATFGSGAALARVRNVGEAGKKVSFGELKYGRMGGVLGAMSR